MMMLRVALIVLFLQITPAMAQTAAKATVSGVVVNSVTGQPVANVRVSLAKFGVSLGPFAQMIAGQAPASETVLPAEFFAAASSQLSTLQESTDPEVTSRANAFAALPLSEIHEIVIGPAGTAVVLKSTPPAMTDEQGRFAFADVEPGRYKLAFAATGYAKLDYGQRTSGVTGVPMTLVAGEKRTDIAMRLPPVGAVNGHIRDTSGQPLAAVPVQLVKFIYDQSGQRRTQRIATTRSNDRGEFRLFYLSPGRYFLSAGNAPGLQGPDLGGGYSPPNRPSQNYALTYYPGVNDENAARAIEVQPGEDLLGVDLFIGLAQTYKVRGRVLDPKSGQNPPSVGLNMSRQNTDANISATSSVGAGEAASPNYKAVDGTFELPNIAPGTYTLTASLPAPASNTSFEIESAERLRVLTDAARARSRATTTVRVTNADVDGIVLTLGTSGSITGRIRPESNAPNGNVPMEFIRIQLRRPNAGPILNMDNEPNPKPVKPDGSFLIENVLPDEYRVSFFGLPDGFYVKEARWGDADVLDGRLRVTGTEPAGLEVVISPKTGTIEGMTSPGTQVALIPNRRERPDLFRTVLADSAGRFSVQGIAPGDYIIAAWETLEPYAFFDREVLEQVEASGRRVQVAESSSQTINVTPIR